MGEREDLARVISHAWDQVGDIEMVPGSELDSSDYAIADAIIAAGWRRA